MFCNKSVNQDKVQLVERLLDDLEPSTYKKGLNYYANKSIELVSEGAGLYHFEVEGSRAYYYDVHINLGDDIEMEIDRTFCDCPQLEDFYECKHVAAALLYINENVELTEDVELFPSNSIQGDLFSKSLPLQFLIAEDELDKLPGIFPDTPSTPIHYQFHGIHLIPDGIIYSMYLNGSTIELRVIYDSKSGQLELGYPTYYNYDLYKIYQFLKERFSEKFRDQDYLTQKIRDQTKKRILEEKGLIQAVNNWKEAIDFKFSGNEIFPVYTGELEGYREPEEFVKNFLQINQKPEIDQLEDLKKSDLFKEMGKYNLGFGLTKIGQNLKVHPLIGKGKKSDPRGLHTRLDILQDSRDPRLENRQGIPELLDVMNSYTIGQDKKEVQRVWAAGLEFFRQAAPYSIILMRDYMDHVRTLTRRDLYTELQPVETQVKFKLEDLGNFYKLRLLLCFEEREHVFDPVTDGKKLLGTLFFLKERLLFFKNFREYQGFTTLFKILPYQFPKNQLERVIDKIILPLCSYLPFEDDLELLQWTSPDENPEEELYISELAGMVAFIPKVIYGEKFSVNPLDPSYQISPDSKLIWERDLQQEQEYVNFLENLHPHLDRKSHPLFMVLPAGNFSHGSWFLQAYEQLKERGVRIYGMENLKIKRYSPFTASISTHFSSDQDWFGIHSQIQFGEEKIPLKTLKKTWDSGERFVQLRDGSLGEIPQNWMKKMIRLLHSGELSGEEIRLNKIHFMLLEEWEDSSEFAEVSHELEEKKKRMEEIAGITSIQAPQRILASLRPYQESGLSWLNFLNENQWGGILADDMGLGKTVQMIALICQLEEKNPQLKVLVVAPTTLLFNWRRELDKFAPHLDYFIHHGSRYETKEELAGHQMVLTSYGLIINDLELLRELEWDLIVADESQAIKNTSSLRYKAMVRLKGKQKIALTGTPIENGIQELYAQMNFTNPGFFKNLNQFKENYLQPIRKADTEVTELLKRQISPFVLRRTKKEVLTELPEKTEEYLFCEMKPAQRATYESKRKEYRDLLLNKIDQEGLEQSKLFVLEGLTRLRQICDSPQLTGEFEEGSSAKIEMLQDHILHQVGNHKILIFSQFVKMLDLIRENLDRRSISYAYLDGKTSLKEREIQVHKFQQKEDVRVFLISLKAGGTGLNLTAADYVYIVDPWWNPAAENQAIDRCYRMGQEKHVMAYRMICKDSIEEKIMELQSSKLKLAKDIIGEGEGILAGLDGKGILELFS